MQGIIAINTAQGKLALCKKPTSDQELKHPSSPHRHAQVFCLLEGRALPLDS